MDLIVTGAGVARFGKAVVPVAVGWGGCRLDKREGDGSTPLGAWALREVLYRGDRLVPPATALPVRALRPADGWCDDPADPAYNRPVALPYAGRAEALWRADAIYDLIAVMGYNDDPPVPGHGSAIFLHCATPDFAPTAGCVALAPEELRRYLEVAGPTARVLILT